MEKLEVVGVQEAPAVGRLLLGRHTSSGGNMLNRGDLKVEYVLQLFLSYIWIYTYIHTWMALLRWDGIR